MLKSSTHSIATALTIVTKHQRIHTKQNRTILRLRARADPVITREPERTYRKLEHRFTLNNYGYSRLPFSDSHPPSSIYREKTLLYHWKILFTKAVY